MRRTIAVVISCLAIVLILGLFYLSNRFISADKQILNVEKKVSVENYLKIEARPFEFIPGKTFSFFISLEAPQNPAAVKMDLTKTAFLIDDREIPISPVSWEERSQSDFQKSGVLLFPAPATLPAKFSISIFELEERVFEWNL